jgi:hypothetical protein
MEEYFTNGLDSKYGGVSSMYTISASSSVSETTIKTLFNKYSTSSGIIDGEGIEKFFEDINVDMMDVVTLVIMHAMGA